MPGPRRLALLLLALWLPGVARAEPKDDARRAFVAGLDAAATGDYQRAVDLFLEAQRLYPHPATTFNIARAYDDLGQPAEALRWYRRFAEEYPERAAEAAAPIASLEARLAPRDLPAAPPAPPADAAGSATQEELERLRAVADELARLADALAARGPADAPTTDAPTTEPPPADLPPADAPPAGDGAFLTDAYERVVVTASRYGQDPLDSPSTISVITADDIRLSGATNLADVLRRVVGVDVMSLAIGSPSVGVRGFNSELSTKVLWLVDGRTVYWDLLAAPLPFNLPVALEEIERIEIIRGPGSAVYGANAVTGVINILTRPPGEGPRALAKFSGGYPDFLQATALASGHLAGLGYRFSAGYDQEGRWAREPGTDEGGAQVPFLEDQDLGTRRVRAHGRIDHGFLDKGFASISGGYTQGVSEFYNIGALGNYGLEGRTHYLRGDLSYGPVHLRTFWNAEDMRTGPWLSPAGARDLDARLDSDVVDVEAEGSFRVQTGPVSHQIQVGAGYRYKRFRFDYLSGGFDNPWVEHHANVFLQEQLTWEWFGAVLSFRLDRHPLLPLSKTLSPRGALIFRVAPQTSLRLNGGTSYRAMNAVESYMDFELATAADGFYVRDFGGMIGRDGALLDDSRLSPERVVTVELGAHDASSPFHEADVAIYWNRVTDLIGLASVTPTLTPYDPDAGGFQAGTTGWENYGDLRYDAFGGELDVKLFPVNGLDVFANVALQRTFERSPEGTVVDGSSSLAKVNLGAMYRAPFRMDFSLMGHYTSAQTWRLRDLDALGQLVVQEADLPDRFVLSARVAGRPLPKRDLELAVTLWNPLGFGDGFQEHPKGQPVGARVFGSVALGF